MRDILDELLAKGVRRETIDQIKQWKTAAEALAKRRKADRKRQHHVTRSREVTLGHVTINSLAKSTNRSRDQPHLLLSYSKQEAEKELFIRGKQVLGKNAGGMIAKLLRFKDGSVELARATIETAATKQDPREYVARVIHKQAETKERDYFREAII